MDKLKSLVSKKSFLITFTLIILGSLITLLNLIPNDYWWHVKAGEYIVQNKSIPFTDVFSWYGIENNLYWHSHEWLSEVVIYLTSLIGGRTAIVIFVAFCVTALFLILYKTNKEYYEKHFCFTLLWVLIGSFLFAKLLSPRPHMISFILFTLTVWLLYRYRNNENTKSVWFIPFISLLWVNFHGGSSNLPYVLAVLFIITGLFDFKIGKIKFDKISRKQIKTYFMVGAVSFLVLVLNPHGLDMITYPYINMGDTVMLSFIGEWRSPDLKILQDILFIAPILVSMIIFIITEKDISFIDLTMIGAFSYLTLKSVRFSAFLYIIASYIIFRYLDNSKLKDIKNKTINDLVSLMPSAFKRLYILIIGSMGVFTLLLLTTNQINDLFNKDIVSSEIVEIIKEENPERLFNDYNYGGYLIYNDIKPMIDGRADMYSETLLKDYINYSNFLRPELRERYDFDYLLVDKGLRLDNLFISQPEHYEKLAEDKKSVLYKNLKYKTKPEINSEIIKDGN